MHAAMNLRWSKLGISFLLLIIATVDAFCPPGCTCSNETRNVICDNVKVDSIPIFLNPALTRLSLRNSQVRLDKDSIRLYKGALHFFLLLSHLIGQCLDLEYLDLSHNQIEEFPEEFFDQLTNLKDLRLTGNRIAKLDTNLFANTERLEVIRIFSCKSDRANAQI
jgi:Leucine-rich repeat (LRR) protein